jgi:hypothetical protein
VNKVKLKHAWRVFSGEKFTSFINTSSVTRYALHATNEVLTNITMLSALQASAKKEDKDLNAIVCDLIFKQTIQKFSRLGLELIGELFTGEREIRTLNFLRCWWWPTTNAEHPYLFSRQLSAFRSLGSFRRSPLSNIRGGINRPEIATRMMLMAMYQAHQHIPESMPVFGHYFAKCKELGLPVMSKAVNAVLTEDDVDARPWRDYRGMSRDSEIEQEEAWDMIEQYYGLTEADFMPFKAELDDVNVAVPARMFPEQDWLTTVCRKDYGVKQAPSAYYPDSEL